MKWLRRTAIRQFCKRVLHRDNWIILPTGLQMRLPRTSRFSTEVFVTHCNVDWGSEALFANLIDPFGAFMDVGANVGYYSLYVLPKVVQVHAFEPDTRASVSLRQNLSSYPNTHVHSMALGSSVGRIGFVEGKSSEISHVIRGVGTHEVEVTTLDHFVSEQHISVSGIKIDAEGADLEVLYGAKYTLQSQCPLVLTEAKPEDALFDFLEPLTYKVFAFVKMSGTFYLRKIDRRNRAETKMLFLAPPQLHRKFEQIAEEGYAI